MIVMFPADDPTTGDKATTGEVVVVLIFSFLVTCCLTLEIVLSKVLAKRGVDGKYIGFSFLLAEGILGTICLVGATIAGHGLQIIDQESFWLMILAGLSGVIAISLL